MAEARVGEERVPVVIAWRLEKRRPDVRTPVPSALSRAVSCAHTRPAHAAPNVTNIEKVEEGVADVQLASGERGYTEARQQKERQQKEKEDTTLDLLLKHLNETFTTCV
jgi:hypothetical protein